MADTGHIDIDYVANLARIALSEDEKAAFSQQLGNVLSYIEKLKTVDVSGVEPTAHPFEVCNVWREDEPAQPLPAESAIRNAPATRDNMVVVPKVVDEA